MDLQYIANIDGNLDKYLRRIIEMTGSLFLMMFVFIAYIIFSNRLYGLLKRSKELEDHKEKKLNKKFRKELNDD